MKNEEMQYSKTYNIKPQKNICNCLLTDDEMDLRMRCNRKENDYAQKKRNQFN